jgi:hypothetical protein
MVKEKSCSSTLDVIELRPRASSYVKLWLFSGFFFVLGLGLLAVVLTAPGGIAGRIFPASLGAATALLTARLMLSHRPGTNSLRLDADGFTYRQNSREQRRAWQSAARMVIVNRRYGYQGVGSRAAGIEITFREQPYAQPLFIGDQYDVRRRDLLTMMSSRAGADVATMPPVVSPQDATFDKKLLRVEMLAFIPLYALMYAGSVIALIHKGYVVNKALFIAGMPMAAAILLQYFYII